jgi:hybrid cluster-associated redox disulfide protein
VIGEDPCGPTARELPGPTSVVAAVLRDHPQAVRVFLDHHMACVGCALAEFDTLADAARAYGLALPDLLAELGCAAVATPGAAEP